MALFVHVTQRCEQEAARAGWQGDLENLRNKVEQAQDLQGFDHFPAPYRVKKKFPRYNARVIASIHAVGDHDVACFLSILTKADWVKSKQRLETFYRGEKQYRRADDIREEIAKVETTHGIQPTELAVEYPELDTLNALLERELGDGISDGDSKSVVETTPTQPAVSEPTPKSEPGVAPPILPEPRKSDAEVTVGQIKLKLSRENKRINLEHQATSKTSSIRLSPVACTSDDVKWTSQSAGPLHECEEWGLKVDFSKLESERLVIVRLDAAGVQICFESV